MESFNGANKMVGQWMRVEHYRLHCAEGWPDSPYKKAVLAAIRSTMEHLKTASPALIESQQCMVCASRKTNSVVLMFPSVPQASLSIQRLAA
jgi:hypothetical protein